MTDLSDWQCWECKRLVKGGVCEGPHPNYTKREWYVEYPPDWKRPDRPAREIVIHRREP